MFKMQNIYPLIYFVLHSLTHRLIVESLYELQIANKFIASCASACLHIPHIHGFSLTFWLYLIMTCSGACLQAVGSRAISHDVVGRRHPVQERSADLHQSPATRQVLHYQVRTYECHIWIIICGIVLTNARTLIVKAVLSRQELSSLSIFVVFVGTIFNCYSIKKYVFKNYHVHFARLGTDTLPEGTEDSVIRKMVKEGEESFAYMFHHYDLIQVLIV